MTIELGRYGIWRRWQQMDADLVAEIERLGFGAVWVGSSPDGDLGVIERYLDGTSRIAVGTSIVNMWKDDAAAVAASYHRIAAKHPDRFLLGVGIGHREQTAQYTSPYDTMVRYLDDLDAASVPPDGRVLAALGTKALRLAADRTSGAIPYLVTPEHTRRARAVLGAASILAPEQKVVLEADPERARQIARPALRGYLRLSNYVNNLRRLGYGEQDVAGDGSDRLIDDLALHGSVEQVAAGLREHLDAGADHVAVQLLTEPDADPVTGYTALAAAVAS